MIKNRTKKTILSEKFQICKSPMQKAFGLMFSKPKTLAFKFKKEKIVPLHMLFVFFPIDVIFLNENKKVIELKENFMPLSFYTPKKKANYIIELPCGKIKKSGTKLGDKLEFRF